MHKYLNLAQISGNLLEWLESLKSEPSIWQDYFLAQPFAPVMFLLLTGISTEAINEKEGNYLERPSDVEGVSSEDRSESVKHGMTLFAHRAEIAADPAKGGDARFTAKGASDLLLNFDHAKVPLGLIVRKGNGQIVQKGQQLVCAPQQVIQQILAGRLLRSSPSLRSCL